MRSPHTHRNPYLEQHCKSTHQLMVVAHIWCIERLNTKLPRAITNATNVEAQRSSVQPGDVSPLFGYTESSPVRTSLSWLGLIWGSVGRNATLLLLGSHMIAGKVNGLLVSLGDWDFMLLVRMLESGSPPNFMFRHPQFLSAPTSSWLDPQLHYLCGPTY